MATLKELIAQKEALEHKIAEATAHNHTEGVAKVKELMAEYGLTTSDLSGRGAGAGSSKSASSGSKVAAKYRNSATGESWSGRGLQPRWLKAEIGNGKKIEDFAV